MLINGVTHVATIVLIVFIGLRFYALAKCWLLIKDYYAEEGTTQKSYSLWIKSLVFYMSWFFVSLFLLTILRLISLYYMFKSFRYIKKREEDALKKKQRKLELSHRARKNKIRKEKLKKKIKEKELIEKARRGELEAMNEEF